MKVVAQNRKALHDYHVEESFEAGIALVGTEVKSLREGRVNLKESYVQIKDGEAYLLGCHISPYSHGNITNHEPMRPRKLLLHKKELEKLKSKVAEKGYTVVPLKIYFKGHLAKLEIALAKGKRVFEKREAIKEKEAKREIDRAMKGSNTRA